MSGLGLFPDASVAGGGEPERFERAAFLRSAALFFFFGGIGVKVDTISREQTAASFSVILSGASLRAKSKDLSPPEAPSNLWGHVERRLTLWLPPAGRSFDCARGLAALRMTDDKNCHDHAKLSDHNPALYQSVARSSRVGTGPFPSHRFASSCPQMTIVISPFGGCCV